MSGENFWRLLREKAGKTQAEMAANAGVSIDTWRTWEGGRAVPSLASAEKVAGAVGGNPLVVMVGAAALSARKSVENGDSAEPILRRVENLADLAEAAESAEDREVLTAGARELLEIARSASKSAGDEDERDIGGRRKVKIYSHPWEKSERDELGKQTNKVFERGFERATGDEVAERSDNPGERDLQGRGKKLFNR